MLRGNDVVLYVAEMVCKTAKWGPSITGPLLPSMTDSLLAPGCEVLYKRYHTGVLEPGCLVPMDALPSVRNIVACTEHCVQRNTTRSDRIFFGT